MRPLCLPTFIHHNSTEWNENYIFGNRISNEHPWYWTPQHSTAHLLLAHQTHPCMVSTANEAEIIIVVAPDPPSTWRPSTPVVTDPENTSIAVADSWSTALLKWSCVHATDIIRDILRLHKHRRPIIAVAGESFFSFCGFCSFAARTPLPADVRRHVSCLTNTFAEYDQDVSIAYPSSIHINHRGQSLPWQSSHARNTLISFTGSIHGNAKAQQIRFKIRQVCESYGAPTCSVRDVPYGRLTPAILRDLLEVKRDSVFCIEPPGYGPERKSIVDSLMLGCIPVIMNPEFGLDSLWKTNWRWWSLASVWINGDKFLNGTLDLVSILQQLPAQRIADLQRGIREHAHELHWGVYTPSRPSAFESLLRALTWRSRKYRARHVAPPDLSVEL